METRLDQIKEFIGGLDHVEEIAVHPDGYIWAGGVAGQIYIIAPDERMLYVACTCLPDVERIPILKDGSAGKRSVFVPLPQTCPDGLAFDAEENLYMSYYAPNRIYRISLQQEVQLLVDDWEGHTLSKPTNIAFGGPNFDQLYTSNLGRYHIHQIDFGVRGAPWACHQYFLKQS